jgi:hypothetical protein
VEGPGPDQPDFIAVADVNRPEYQVYQFRATQNAYAEATRS